MEKRPVVSTTSVYNNASPQPLQDASTVISKWHPGYGTRFPWAGFSALVVVIICTVSAVAVLIGSNNVSSSNWPQSIQPNVCLSIINSVANIALTMAITEGIAIAWWRKAMKGATVAELHQSWAFSTSVTNVLSHLWAWDAIALAALAAKLSVIDGVLFQRATTAYTAQDPPLAISAMGIAATEFPSTGYIVSNTSYGAQANCGCFMIGDAYTPVVNTWETSNGFYRDYNDWFRVENRGVDHCDGTCFTTIDAIGFEIDCSGQEPTPQNIATAPITAYRAGGDPAQWTDVPIFNSSFALQYPDQSDNFTSIVLNLHYFQSDDPYNPSNENCPGQVYDTVCRLRPALVTYPVKIMNFTNPHVINGVSLGSRSQNSNTFAASSPPVYNSAKKQAEGFKVGQYLDVFDEHRIGGLTALGGLANALSQFLSSTATITYKGEADSTSIWTLDQRGTLAQTMMYGPPNMGSCDCSFRSESLDTIIQGINQLTFLTALGMVQNQFTGKQVHAGDNATVIGIGRNTTTVFRQLASTSQITEVVHYSTNYWFAGFGVGATLFCILLIVPSFWRYGELGRHVTLGPIEVANAFRAPMLVSDQPKDGKIDGGVDNVIKEVGDRKVMYGFVDVSDPTNNNPNNRNSTFGLALGSPDKVRPVSGVWSPPTSPRVSGPMSPRPI